MLTDRRVPVEGQTDLGAGYYLLRLHAPPLASAARAGQFVMLGLPDLNDMLIRRPFSVARIGVDRSGAATTFEILYKVVGRGTQRFSRLSEGSELVALGPLGRGFDLTPLASGEPELVLVAGGIGNAPFPLLLQQLGPAVERTVLLFGGRGRADLTLLEWYRERCRVIAVTEDGSEGRRGLVTAPLVELLDRDPARRRLVLACGPHPMLRAVTEICLARDVPCQVAMEETMACGFGVCLGCVVPKRRPTGEFDRFVRVCKEGPVFDAREIIV